MSTYISCETARQILMNAYLVSAVLLIATSYIGLAVLKTLETSTDKSPHWFP